MKYLRKMSLTSLLVVGIFLNSSTNVVSDHGKHIWSKGDNIATELICRDEDSILKIIKADTVSEGETHYAVVELLLLEKCLKFDKPVTFKILNDLIDYVDHNGVSNVVLILSNPLEANESFVFTIGFGKYKENYDKDI
jgi:hypothetical protein